MVTAHLAVAHAAGGDERNTLVCLSLARDELDRDNAADGPRWLTFFDHVELHATHATALAHLPNLSPSRRTEAIDRIKLALAHRAPALIRARALDLLTLSTLLLGNDDIDDAIRIANQAIDLAARLRSHQVIHRVTRLTANIDRHHDRDGTRALLHRIALLTTTAQPPPSLAPPRRCQADGGRPPSGGLRPRWTDLAWRRRVTRYHVSHKRWISSDYAK